MNIAVPSRFACLKIEDDEGQQSNRKQQPADGGKKKVPEGSRKAGCGGNGKKPAQKMSSNPKRAKKVQEQMQKQWEEWKEKDDKFVNGNYEQDLESALLLSKIHYEENKDKYVSKQLGKKHEKKKKTKTMSLDEFLAKDAQVADADCNNKEVIENENFFEQLHSETKKLCKKDEVSQLRKDRENAIEELISSSQYNEKLEIERKRNKDLEEELQKAREEISNVKIRNQTLCTMLSTGEMKDKADVLLELERLNIIKNDLTDEVARLHGLLEQERSKVASLTAASQENANNKQHKENKKPAKKSARS